MQGYLDLLKDVLNNGTIKPNRTGIDTLSVFGRQWRVSLEKGFPLLTTKKLHVKSIVHELLWFLSGSSNTKYLKDNGVTIWDAWCDEDGELGHVYGVQWRRWENGKKTIDQIKNVIKDIKETRNSRRLIVCAWNVAQLEKMALPPCHVLFQFYVDAEDKLSCQLYQRSADLFLGVPFNVASYSLLTHMIAKLCGLKVGDFIHTFGDLHLYTNHIYQAKHQLMRVPYVLPTLQIQGEQKTIDDFKYEDFVFDKYHAYPHIKADVAV